MGEKSGRWLRVSTSKQDEGSQLPDVEAWEESHGYDVKAEYVVHGGSAFKGNRKFDDMWAQVVRDILNGVITVLVVWKTDRIDRKLQTYEMIKEVVAAGGRVEFVTQPHLNDLSTMGGRIALNVQSEIAHEESKVKSDRIRATQNTIRANDGVTGRPPFGYASEGAKYNRYLVPTAIGLKYVPEIFGRCIAGDSLITIAKWLDSEGITTDQGRKWSVSALKHIVNNQTYMGYRSSRDGRVIGTCEPIITADIFKAANDALSSRPKRGAILAKNRALCSGVLYCPKCGGESPMYRLAVNDGPVKKDGTRAKAYFYRCAGRGAQRRGCGNMVRLEDVDAAVDESMSNNHQPIMKRVYVPGHNHDAQVADVNFRIKQLDPEAMSDDEYDAALKALRSERDSYLSMPAVPDSWMTEPVMDGSGNVVTYAGKWAAADAAGRRAMLEETRVTASWTEIDGTRYPTVLIVPKWATL